MKSNNILTIPNPWYLLSNITIEDFIFGMLNLGNPIDVNLVGVFEDTGRGSLRDVELPLHRDGEYSEKLAKTQGGTYVEAKNVDIVGMYCLKSSDCETLIEYKEMKFHTYRLQRIILKKNQCLVWDNKTVRHGRQGKVGDRLILRIWIHVT